MELEHCGDFDRVRESWRRFWAGELNRPIVCAYAQKPGVEPAPAPPWAAAYTQDHEAVVDQALRHVETHEFLIDAVPFHTPSICMGLFGAMLGAQIQESREEWGVDTHPVPFLDPVEDAEVAIDRDGPWWEKFVSLLDCYRRKCSGKLIFGEAAVPWNLDFLAQVCDRTAVMMAFYDHPEAVLRKLEQLQAVEVEILAEIRRRAEVDTWGSVTRHGLYSPGFIGVPQCDFGFNLGKSHFDTFALPFLRRECALLDAVEYHLDGEGNLCHLDSLCSIDEIGVFQWVAGAGEGQQRDWQWLYDDITSRGKGRWVGGRPEDVLSLWERWGGSRQLAITVRSDDLDALRRLEETVLGMDEV